MKQLRQFSLQSWNMEFEQTAQSKPMGTARWLMMCCSGQPNPRVLSGVPQLALNTIQILSPNSLISMAS